VFVCGSAWTPLHWAAALGYEDIIRMLLDNGANPSIGSKSGKLPADLARMQGYHKIGMPHSLSSYVCGSGKVYAHHFFKKKAYRNSTTSQ
jgi:hypothetical protein